MHTLAESATHTSGVNVPDDGVDPRTAASIEPAFQALANRTKLVHEYFAGTIALPATLDIPAGIVAGTSAFDGISCSGDVSITGGHDLSCSGSGSFSGGVDCGGNLDVTGASNLTSVTCTGGVNIYGLTSCNAGLRVAGGVADFVDGARRKLRTLALPNFSSSFLAKDYDLLYVDAAAGTLNFTISDTGARDGDSFRLINYTNQSIALKLPDTSTIKTLTSGFVTPTWVDMYRLGGIWRLGPSG